MRSALVVPLFLCALAFASPSTARAQDAWRYFSARAEITGGGMLPNYQTGPLGYGAGVAGGIHLGVRPIAPLVIQLGASGLYLPSDAGAGSQWLLGGGLRIEPRLGDVGWLVIDGNAGVVLTGPLTRFGFDASIGFELSIADVLGIGPIVRYTQTIADGVDWPSDAIMLTGGVSVSLRGEEPRLVDPDGDRDGDGVLDSVDLCVDVSAGDTPDPQRAGCPLGDGDGDGISDRDDVCPTIPAGDTPDPQRLGCPALDSDLDGVLDQNDLCPTAASGDHPDPTRVGCPSPDTDGDGIVDALDACPADVPGLHPDPDRAGCPLPDRDHDSVPDTDDTCPDEMGSPSPHREHNGCPGLVRVDRSEIHILRPVFFATGRDTILPQSRGVLQAVADAMIATPTIRRVSIEGHTDDVGEEATNLELSLRRAHEVMAWLIHAGVDASRLEAQGFGESRPLVPATTESSRAVNRRVEIRILDVPSSGTGATP